jgi:hypothetical protein
MQGWRLPLASALALSLGLTPVAPVMAAPAAMPPTLAKAEAGRTVVEVNRRSYNRGYGHRHHRHGGRNLAIGLGIGVIGGLIAADAYRNAPAYADDEEVYDAAPAADGDPRELCAQEFQSFEWKTGLYTTYSGKKERCPYLR